MPVGSYTVLLDEPYRVDTPVEAPLRFPITAAPAGRLDVPVVVDQRHHGRYSDLLVTARLDKPAYLGSDAVKATVTVRNNGNVIATGVGFTLDGIGGLSVNFHDLGGLPRARRPGGITLAPGQTREFVLTGFAYAGAPALTTTVTAVGDQAELDQENNSATVSAPVVVGNGDLTGAVFLDLDADGVVDPGEGIPGVEVTASARSGGVYVARRTESDGRFSISGIDATGYVLKYSRTNDKYEIPGGAGGSTDYVAVTTAGLDLPVPAVLVPDKAIQARVSFDREFYHPGDTAQVTFRFLNTSDYPLAGVGVRNNPGDGDFPVEADWALIGLGQPGLAIAPREEEVVTVPVRIPATAGGRCALHRVRGGQRRVRPAADHRDRDRGTRSADHLDHGLPDYNGLPDSVADRNGVADALCPDGRAGRAEHVRRRDESRAAAGPGWARTERPCRHRCERDRPGPDRSGRCARRRSDGRLFAQAQGFLTRWGGGAAPPGSAEHHEHRQGGKRAEHEPDHRQPAEQFRLAEQPQRAKARHQHTRGDHRHVGHGSPYGHSY
ncbi:hypothetical protein JOD54_001478 [Actinokineospora baliensis]|uniref:hypothetical protein n=1 Tax=Actinokineospora baliensis TaxID=547056 RepID=UPI00195920AD|nr:hypothetical protein [Actinokineospora baliensis]MBM7771274.1 hypothetical protein [Actinokineospora baliensis]